jgi:hypothetical protein
MFLTSETPKASTLFNTHLVNQDMPAEKKETPEVKPAEKKAAWKPGGYTPHRSNLHTAKGKIK